MSTIDEYRSNPSIFQWNTGDLCQRLSNFCRLVFKYKFHVIDTSQSKVNSDFRISSYEMFQSNSGTVASPVLPGIRKDLTVIKLYSHPWPRERVPDRDSRHGKFWVHFYSSTHSARISYLKISYVLPLPLICNPGTSKVTVLPGKACIRVLAARLMWMWRTSVTFLRSMIEHPIFLGTIYC